MKYLVTLILLLQTITIAGPKDKIEERLELNISSFATLSYTTNAAISAIVHVATHELERTGSPHLAKRLREEWKQFDGYLTDAVVTKRDIGWFKPLIEWLSLFYETVELALGLEICRALRLSDLKTINHGIVVVFRPCYFGINEFKLHFIHDSKYRGFAPVITYWSAAIACTTALHGAGYYLICSPAAMVLERVVDKKIAPKVAPKLYDLACST